ncbi:hypothetical protein ABH931_006337 [Streptacidiphilus sp. MAP12-33]
MLSIPRRRPLVWALCAALSVGAWVLLLTGREAAGVGLMFAGGWNVSLLPVHARPLAGPQGRGEPREEPPRADGPAR